MGVAGKREWDAVLGRCVERMRVVREQDGKGVGVGVLCEGGDLGARFRIAAGPGRTEDFDRMAVEPEPGGCGAQQGDSAFGVACGKGFCAVE